MARETKLSSFFPALAAALTLLASPTAHAFCRTRTVAASPDAAGCATDGVPVFHPSTCLTYRLRTKDSPVIPNAILSEKLATAFATWTAPNASCAPGIAVIEIAPTDATEIVAYRTGERGNNVIGVPEVWRHDDASDPLAIPTVTFNANTGEIYDIDMEINPTVRWSFGDAPAIDGFDLLAILTHETGHLLGLAHADDPATTMFASYTPGSVDQRTLSEDDQAGICAIYPNRTERIAGQGLVPATACNLTPGTPDGSCGDPEILHGCAAAPGSTSGALGALVTLLVLVAARRRRVSRA